jgi:serine/threonine-protein kinase
MNTDSSTPDPSDFIPQSSSLAVDRLLDEILDSERTPEEVCVDFPELLPEVRRRWLEMRKVDAELEAMFPTPAPDREAAASRWNTTAELPSIPGYEIEAVLGRGGMGIVYKARHLRLNRPVALKMMLAGAYAGPEERERFLREAEAVAGLRHANIVQVHDMGDHGGRPYFTMEYIEGGSLAQRLMGTPQCVSYAAGLVAILAEAVQVAHQGGIIHRDLKPANILLQPKPELPNLNRQIENIDSVAGSPPPSDSDCRISDFDPKIVDFGLARHFDTGPGLTLSGARIGTPSYMAPEQALGKTHAIGPAVDIYALGAVLYELLTGKPPFRGETSTETEQQVIHQEVVQPSRLNPRVSRDLETICLKCLDKEAARRYATAAALADDLNRFLEGRPIHARPLSWAARIWRWCRRKPAVAALLATLLALTVLATGGGLWLERQRAEHREETARQEGRAWQAVDAALEKAAIFQQQGRWSEARAALEGAQSLLDTSTPPYLVERLRQARTDAEMVAELEEIRLRLTDSRASQETTSASAEKVYAVAFRNYGIPLLSVEPTEAADRIRASSIRLTLLEFLHDWLFRGSEETRARLRDVLDQTDDDDWRRAFRKSLLEKNADELIALAGDPVAPDQPRIVLSCLGGALVADKYTNEALVLLRKAQQRHPGDFWINYLLGQHCSKERPHEAVGYFRVAVAIRPGSDRVYLMLANALLDTGDKEGAMVALRESIARNPNDKAAKDLAKALTPKGGMEEARAAWEKLLKPNPIDHKAWHGYPQLCLYVGNVEAYRIARKAMLEHFGGVTNDWVIAERTSMACLLLPDPGDELQRAAHLADVAVAAAEKSSDAGNPYVKFVKGFALYRQGRHADALRFLEQSAYKLLDRAGPRLVLAMAQFRSGATAESRKTLAAVVRNYNWNEPNPASRPDYISIWVSHVLRREAEAMILPNLAKFLQGKYRPADNDERMALLGICQSRSLVRASARLYAEAFEADPGLAEELNTECLRRATQETKSKAGERLDAFNAASRYLAARCAALAGCGLGKDGADLSGAERSDWRKQARTWLEDDLAMWTKTLQSNSPQAGRIAMELLTHWQTAPELAGIREPGSLETFSEDERLECLALWRKVRDVLKITAQRPVPPHAEPGATPNQVTGKTPTVLMKEGRLNEARAVWQSLLNANPPDYSVWHGYGELCLFLGDEDEYRRARRAMLERFGATTDPYVAERMGRACLLMPVTGDELRQAVAVSERAVAQNSDERSAEPYFEFTRGLAKYRQGDFDGAIVAMRKNATSVLGQARMLVVVMALYKKGQVDDARRKLAAAIVSYDWSATQVRDVYGCILHVLRREAESMILPNLTAFLDGKYRPQTNDERLAFLGVCHFTKRTLAMARLYADAFAAAPSLADDIAAGHRYTAARAAAQAGGGQGADATDLSEEERALCRQQARQWLRAELTAYTRALDANPAAARLSVRTALVRWRREPDFTWLRDAKELYKLPAGERKECLTLWADVVNLLARTEK